jgi:acyl dehydratase
MAEKYLDDLAPGQKYGSGRIRVDAERIKRFAAEFDPQPFHLDEEAARRSIFGGLAASGWHTAALTMRGVGQRRQLDRAAACQSVI